MITQLIERIKEANRLTKEEQAQLKFSLVFAFLFVFGLLAKIV